MRESNHGLGFGAVPRPFALLRITASPMAEVKLHAADYIRNPCWPDIPATHQEGRVHICPLI